MTKQKDVTWGELAKARQDAPQEWPAECSHCSRCKANAAFVWDPYEKEWMSECCWAPAIPVDMEPGIPF